MIEVQQETGRCRPMKYYPCIRRSHMKGSLLSITIIQKIKTFFLKYHIKKIFLKCNKISQQMLATLKIAKYF